MDNLNLDLDLDIPQDSLRFVYMPVSNTWPPLSLESMSHNNASASVNTNSTTSMRANTTTTSMATRPATTTAPPLQTTGLEYHHSMNPAAALLTTTDWQFQLHQPATQQSYLHDASLDPSFTGAYGVALQASPIDFRASTQAQLNNSLALDASTFMAPAFSTSMEPLNAMAFQMSDFQNELMNYPLDGGIQSTGFVPPSIPNSSPAENWLDDCSSSNRSDNGWIMIDNPASRQSLDFSDASNVVVSPQALHIRTDSNSSQYSDVPPSARSFGSYEDVQFPPYSPEPEIVTDISHPHHDQHYHHFHHTVQSSAAVAQPIPIKPSSSSSTSPASSGVSSPTSKRRKSPVGISAKVISKKKLPSASSKADKPTEKRVGRRRGPLRPDQRQQAHEIRKLRACLRCKFLKKTCDKGDPCAGCQPSHARLWQVPCTRIDIKDIAYFLKDWKADYERHVSLGFSVNNIKGFSTLERPLYITHGYGYYLPIQAREVYVRDEKCFGVDWTESIHVTPKSFEINTAKLTAGVEGVSTNILNEYLDRHIDGGFERFVDEYFEGTFFLTEILKTVYRYYLKSQLPVIRKSLKLVIAYNLTLHITMVDGLSEEEAQIGKIDDKNSRWYGKTCAPVMVNFQVKCALAEMWRDLMKDILEELSALYSSVYSGEKLKNWPTIFMLAAVLLAIWEEMQFDCHYRVPEQAAVQKFCAEMEGTPVGVIVGLFSAISQKLPSFTEWDTRKHHQSLNSDPAVCEAMTEVRQHVTKYDPYLRTRNETKFDREDFECLSNKFLAKLVIRAN